MRCPFESPAIGSQTPAPLRAPAFTTPRLMECHDAAAPREPPCKNNVDTSAHPSPDVGGGGSEGGGTPGDRCMEPEHNNKKRKTTSNRGVASMTAEQLAKKRANDREAQRAIRERTKNQIEGLENKIRELTSQQPYQELQMIIRQKDAVEAENADIKKRLTTVLSLIEPVLGRPLNNNELPTFSSTPSYLPQRPRSATNLTPSSSSRIASPSSTPGTGAHQWQPSSNAPLPAQDIHNYTQSQIFNQQRHDLTHGLELGPERLGLDFLLDGTQRVNKIPNGIGGVPPAQDLHGRPPNNVKQDINGSMHSRRSSSRESDHGYSHGQASGETPAHAIPIRNFGPTCPLDSLLLDFLAERRQLAAKGLPTPKLVGPAYPSVSSLLNPERSAQSHPLSKVFTDILATFPDLSTLPEKVAVLYIMFLIMRWQISPTQENYDRLPDWVTPRPSQLFTPHPAWIDHLPWPHMRDKLVRDYNPRDYLFDNFFIPFTTTLSLNWPYEPTDTLLSMEGVEGDLIINPVFERHMRRLENWSLGPAFARAFPGLADTYRLKTDGDRR